MAHNRLVAGSNPAGPTLASQRCGAFGLILILGAVIESVGEAVYLATSY